MTRCPPDSFHSVQENLYWPHKIFPDGTRLTLDTLNLLPGRRNPLCRPALFPRIPMGHTLMSQKSKVIFAALAVAATLGAVQIAAGEAASTANLADRFQALSDPQGAAGINRTAKTDREPKMLGANQGRTVLLKVE